MRHILRMAVRMLRLADRALEVLLFDVLFASKRRALVLGAALAGALLLAQGRGAAPPRTADREADNARMLVGRPWLDHLPENEHDPFRALIFNKKKNVGVAMRATAYRGHWELYLFKATEKRLELFFPHDKRRAETGYSISKTKHGNFDLELTLEDPPLGPKTYYSWKKFRQDKLEGLPLRSLALERWLLPMDNLGLELPAEAE